MALKNLLIFLAVISFIFILVVFGLYMYNFSYLGLSPNQEDWAQFGDYMGGTLNPMLAFFAFIGLLYTIRIQSSALQMSKDELEATRKELKESRIAQQKQSESLELQNKATQLQIFENTFFELVNSFKFLKERLIKEYVECSITGSSEIILKLSTGDVNIGHKENHNYFNKQKIEVIESYLRILEVIDEYDYEKFNSKYEQYTATYFAQIYQILNFIHTSNIDNKERYANIFRSQFSKYELELLFYHCLFNREYDLFKGLVEKYEFFEHIKLNNNLEKKLIDYDIKAFGNNSSHIFDYNQKSSLVMKQYQGSD